ncbi:response regulator [Candidatus Nitrospira neomarina]|uniref:Response regulator n=1 Tax=Candidatus Nitrospira neomarina TaxID=3020899 RepID=A0AA96K0M0_9BACT|nr:response regulator [Candidatus Nitrospira neomarina]WNM62191.1 response regulator [Candidatus Nitrospira neomarina]
MTNELLLNIFNRDYLVRKRETKSQNPSVGKIVMIVDDDKDFRFLLRDRLVRLGLTCVEAENGEVAKNQLNKKDVDLVITDYRMPKMNGLELIDWLQHTHRYVPIILVSGDLSVPIRNKAKHVGVYAIVEKPCSLSELSTKVQEIFNEF